MGKLHTFSQADFERFGQLYDIEFRFPAIQGDTGSDDRIVARGEIAEYSLASGFRFTFSSLQVLQAYESVSSGHAPLLVRVQLWLRIVAGESSSLSTAALFPPGTRCP